MKEMSEIMRVNLNENDISIAHRLPPTKKVKDRLIVKFTRREKRDEIYSKRKNLKSKRLPLNSFKKEYKLFLLDSQAS